MPAETRYLLMAGIDEQIHLQMDSPQRGAVCLRAESQRCTNFQDGLVDSHTMRRKN